MAQDFLDLTFQLENGDSLPRFTRFEGPISVRLLGDEASGLEQELARVLQRIRLEAGVDIALAPRVRQAKVTVQAVPQSEIRRYAPEAACIVAPNVSSLSEYRSIRHTRLADWTRLNARNRVAIFVPSDRAPQDLRDCLHEELAQAIGPLNDLYRLPDSVFNDDDVHRVLTGFDMLMLGVTYHPALRTGMTRAEVAARLPGILAQMNPRGETTRVQQAPLPPRTPQNWVSAIETALGSGHGKRAQVRAAKAALGIARRNGMTDHRLAFSYQALGRRQQGHDPDAARAAFEQARDLLGNNATTQLHRATIAAYLGAFALRDGDATAVLDRVTPALNVARRFENAALLATLLRLKAEALEIMGRKENAASARMDSDHWARYGFGQGRAARARMADIARLSPLKRSRSGF